MDPKQYKHSITDLFSLVAEGYDSPALRFFPFCADRLVKKLRPQPGQKILDIATGTGVVAISCAQALLPGGRITAIDLSQRMLDRVDFHARKMGLENIDLFDMDGERLDFKADYFDGVLCSFGLFFMPDINAALSEWKRVCKPGGAIIFTSFDSRAMQPLRDLFLDELEQCGVTLPEGRTFTTDRLSTVEACQQALDKAGLQDTEISCEQLGYHLHSSDDWWEIIWNSGLRGLLNQVPEDQLGGFKRRHLEAIDALATDKGIWLSVDTIFSRGRKRSG